MMETALEIWQRLDGIKSTLMHRCERYAALTIPKVCLPDGFNPESTDQAHDFQSAGAACVNHLNNKLMLTMFAPSRPFFRVTMTAAAIKKLMATANMQEEDLNPIFSRIERDAVKELDTRGQRPKLYAAGRHIIITGQVLLDLSKKHDLRVLGLKYWCVKRTSVGKVHTLVIRERVKFDELDIKVQEACSVRHKGEDMVDHFKLIQRTPSGDLAMTQWIDAYKLPDNFNGKWPEDECPYKIAHWDLADESDYATGLVEEYVGDFEALSALSEGVVDGAILGMEFRWLVNPTGMTQAEDLNRSKNGDALPGTPADVAPTQGGNPQAVNSALETLRLFETRVNRAFLLNSAITRNAERVTAEEIRMQAMELETALGGAYSTLSAGMQGPIANWLLTSIDASIKGTQLKVVVITGLDALSRNADLEALKLALNDLMLFESLPEPLKMRFNYKRVTDYVGQGRGIDLTAFLLSDAEYKAQTEQAAATRVAEANATEQGAAQAQAQAQPAQ